MDEHRFIALLHDFAEAYSDEVTEYVLRNRKYKKSTIAFLARILDWYGVCHSLREYLSPLSEYKMPTIDELKLDIPENICSHLNAYVEELKKIYKDYLKQQSDVIFSKWGEAYPFYKNIQNEGIKLYGAA